MLIAGGSEGHTGWMLIKAMQRKRNAVDIYGFLQAVFVSVSVPACAHLLQLPAVPCHSARALSCADPDTPVLSHSLHSRRQV